MMCPFPSTPARSPPFSGKMARENRRSSRSCPASTPRAATRGGSSSDGNDYRPADTAAAEQAGVVLVPQEVSVVPQMSVAENICLNAEPTRWGLIDVSLRLAKARSALLDFELDVDPHREMGSLDLATQQLVVIARALSKNLEAADLGRADGCSHGKGVFASLRPDSNAQGPRRRHHIRFPSSVGGLFHFGPHHRHAGRSHPRRSRRQRSFSRRRRRRDVGPRSRRDAKPPVRAGRATLRWRCGD